MNYVEKYIEIFTDGESPSGKTERWKVVNKRSNETIGIIKWYGGFRKYVFYPTVEEMTWVLFDAACMRMIADFIDKVNKYHRKPMPIQEAADMPTQRIRLRVTRGGETLAEI